MPDITMYRYEAAELLEMAEGQESPRGFTKVDDVRMMTGRWYETRQLIVRDFMSQKLYAAEYEHPLTENQDTAPWEGEETVTFYEVDAIPADVCWYRRV